MRAIFAALSSRRFRLSSEARVQTDVAAALAACGIAFARERRLSPRDRVDFLCGAIALEVKVHGGRVAIFRQCARYCEHAAVSGLILATNVAMALPPSINGKPAAVVLLGRAWL